MKAFHVSNLLTLMPNPVHAQNMHFKTKLIDKESVFKKAKKPQAILIAIYFRTMLLLSSYHEFHLLQFNFQYLQIKLELHNSNGLIHEFSPFL